MPICEADLVSTARSTMSMSVLIEVSTTSLSINQRDCTDALKQRFLPSLAITTPLQPKMGMALMLAPRDLRLSRSKAVHHKTPIIPRQFRPSRRPQPLHTEEIEN